MTICWGHWISVWHILLEAPAELHSVCASRLHVDLSYKGGSNTTASESKDETAKPVEREITGSTVGDVFLASCCRTPCRLEGHVTGNLRPNWKHWNRISEVIRALKCVTYAPTHNTCTLTHTHRIHYRVDSASLLLPQCRAAGVIAAGRQKSQYCYCACCTWKTVKLQTLALCSDNW